MLRSSNTKNNGNKQRRKPRQHHRQHAWKQTPPVEVNRVMFGNSLVLSMVRIQIHQCPPKLQKELKQKRVAKRSKVNFNFKVLAKHATLIFAMLPLLGTHATRQGTYSIPGTNHAMIIGEGSNDASRQRNLIETVISQTVNDSAVVQQAEDEIDLAMIKKNPSVFVADTDSVRFVVDTGTNRMIVNDIKLLTKYIPGQGKIKGINGNPTISQGGG